MNTFQAPNSVVKSLIRSMNLKIVNTVLLTMMATVLYVPSLFAQNTNSETSMPALSYVQPPAVTGVSLFAPEERKPQFEDGLQLFLKSIEYPYNARIEGIEGNVIVRFVISEKGNVLAPQVIKGIGSGCDEAAVAALLKTHFLPAIQNGTPVSTVCEIPISFRLTE